MSGGSYALELQEAAFQQDFNGDGTIGVVSSVVETAGTTKLARVADFYFMYQGSGTTGAVLRQNGDYVVAGSSPWTALGAERWSGGFQVVWKNGSADQYTLWTTDMNGNFLASSNVMSGASAALRALETSFGQDFNANGTIGLGMQESSLGVETLINSSGTADVALLTNYMASTFAAPAGEGTGTVVAPQMSDQGFLAKPS
jgi:hypothetical protein